MKEDSEIVMRALRYVRDNYVNTMDRWTIDNDPLPISLARLNAEIARRIPQGPIYFQQSFVDLACVNSHNGLTIVYTYKDNQVIGEQIWR